MEVSGYQLKSFLKFLDITQDEASKRLNVSRQTINTWCKLAVLDDSALQNVKSVFSQFENWISDNFNSASIVSEPSNDYKSLDPLSQLIRNNTILVESNAVMADSVQKLTNQILELYSNKPPISISEAIETMKKEIAETIRGELKNNHAREDVGCADAG